MKGSGPVAGRGSFSEFPAWGWAPFVDSASRLHTGPPGQRCTSRWQVVGATHPAQRIVEFVGQPCGDPPPVLIQLIAAEIDPKTRAAGTADQAGRHQSRPSSRYSTLATSLGSLKQA